MSDPIEEMAEDAVREIWRGPRTATRIKSVIDSRYRDLAAKEAMCRDDRVAEREKQVRELRDRVEYLEGAWFVDETICKDGSLRPDITKTLARLRVAEVQVRDAEAVLVSAKMDYDDIAGQIKWLLNRVEWWQEKHLTLDTRIRELEERLVSDRALLIAERDAALDGVRKLVLAARALLESGQTDQTDDMGTFCIGCGEYDSFPDTPIVHKRDCLVAPLRAILEHCKGVK